MRMTALQAMDHPWIRKHFVVVDHDKEYAATSDEGWQDVPFVEVMFREGLEYDCAARKKTNAPAVAAIER